MPTNKSSNSVYKLYMTYDSRDIPNLSNTSIIGIFSLNNVCLVISKGC